MLALGLTLVVSVAAAPPAVVHDKVESTFDEAFCDPSDGGECADEVLVDFMPAPAFILDCESPLIADMIGSCDLPAPMLPTLRVVTTLHNGGSGFTTAPSSSSEHLLVVATATSVDGALSAAALSLHAAGFATRPLTFDNTSIQEVPRARLDRPPRA